MKLPISDNHQGNFLASVKSRQPTITPVETAHHSAIPGHLGLISMLVGRRLKWDAKKEQIIGDADASKLLSRPYRAPWQIAGYAGRGGLHKLHQLHRYKSRSDESLM